MEKNKPIVVGIGELLWDVLPTGKRAGGAPVNFVYHATQMGAEGYAVSAVGNDVSGTEITRELDVNGICHSLGVVEHPTGSVMVELKAGVPSYTIIEGVAWDYIPLTQKTIDLVKSADAVCFGTLALRSPGSKETILTLLSYAREEALRFFDINIRQSYYSKELIEILLQKANVFKINDEELLLIRAMFDLSGSDEEVCRWFIGKYNLRYLILTAGSHFSSVYTADEVSTIPTPRIKEEDMGDTVGAGDSFSGAFIYSILTGQSLSEAHQAAVETAAFVCTREGAWPAYPVKE